MTRLDRIDIRILMQLEKHGRITNFELSGLIGLSPSPCLQRVKRLEKAGIIKRYRTEIDWKGLCSYFTVIAEVTLKNHTASHFQEFEKLIAPLPEISHCYALCGAVDYVLHITSRDIETYQRITDHLLRSPVAIDKICSFVVMREVKANASFPFDDPRTAESLAASGKANAEGGLVYGRRAPPPVLSQVAV
jgi:Lrp/AsnC family transcriptional regulator of ectoine degradation